jgi:hypothetical protein
MAKKRRASLKDKDPEMLGITQKKGKGIDLLFGEGDPAMQDAAGENSADADNASASANFDDDLSGIMNFEERPVDELGLPVALEAPPDDLILASTPAGLTPNEEADPVNTSTSPFTMPDLNSAEAGFSDNANDLSGILEEENQATAEETILSTSAKETNLPANVVQEGDLSGLTQQEAGMAAPPIDNASAPTDLSGLAAETEGAPAGEADTDLSGLVTEEDELAGLAAEADMTSPSMTPPPTTAAPINVPPPTTQPAYDATIPPMGRPNYTAPSTSYDYGMSQPGVNIPPPSTATGAPNLSPPRPTNIELEAFHQNVANTLSSFGAALPNTRESFLPTDPLPNEALVVRPMEPVAHDEAITQQVLNYIGAERRNELFEEILALNKEVPERLNNNKADVNFALETLREANNLIIEDPRQYDEALYRVALVKTMLARKARFIFWSYRMGAFVLLYGLIWTIVCIWGVFIPMDFTRLLRGDVLGSVYEAVYFSALAGGLGGSVEIFWRLYYRVSITQDFDPQYLMYYLVKPILGFVLGMVMYFLVTVARAIGSTSSFLEAEPSTGFIIAILLGFIAGYRQESVFDMIYVLIKKISPEAASGGTKSVIPLPDEVEVKYHAEIEKTPS